MGNNWNPPPGLRAIGKKLGVGITNPQARIDAASMVRAGPYDATVDTLATGQGLELFFGNIQSYDRTANAYADLSVIARNIALNPQVVGSNGWIIANGLVQHGDVRNYPTSGAGVEVYRSGSSGAIQSFNRNTSQWEPLVINAGGITLQPQGGATVSPNLSLYTAYLANDIGPISGGTQILTVTVPPGRYIIWGAVLCGSISTTNMVISGMIRNTGISWAISDNVQAPVSGGVTSLAMVPAYVDWSGATGNIVMEFVVQANVGSFTAQRLAWPGNYNSTRLQALKV